MFGTDLESAYYNQNQNTQQKSTPIYNLNAGAANPKIQTSSDNTNTQVNIQKPPINSSSPSPPSVAVYEYDNNLQQTVLEQPNHEAMIQQLQLELQKQKTVVQNDSIFDRFASKKKDVFKLLNISLSVLLAISLHYIMGDIIKVYLRNNDFTYNKEILIKSIYPASVLLVLWSLKVFNK